jgi:hypothetical protein
MKAYIDRIEGKTAVVMVENVGEVLIPLKALRFKPYEGMHVLFKIVPDPESQSKTLAQVKALQKRLLKKSS